MGALEITSASVEETQRLGRSLGRLAQGGEVFLLVGEMGVGKTCLAQGIAWGLDIEDYALSPSFVLVREHRGRLPLYHIDFYRLEGVEEVFELGLEDYLYGEGVCVVEWAEKALSLLPQEHLLVTMEFLRGKRRRLRLEAKGERYREMLSHLRLLK